MADVLRRQVGLFGRDGIIFCPNRESALLRAASSTMTNEYIWKCYKEVEKEVIGSWGSGNVRVEKFDGIGKSFVGLSSYFQDKSATKLSISA